MVVRVVLPLEGDAVTVEGAEPVIADGDAMRVAPQVAQHGGRPAEQRQSIMPIVTEKRLSSITRIIL
jgi:hypothetical protein